MTKRKVMIFIDWYLPGLNAGGPVRTCANMVSRLNDEFDFRIVTRDTDLKENQPYKEVKSDTWNIRDDGSMVYYFSASKLSLGKIRQLLAEESPDAIHLNSLFSFYFTILPLLAVRSEKLKCKVVAGPRGMLSKGALAIKPLKKKIFISIAKITGLFNNITWHASTPIEADEIKHTFGNDVQIQLGIDLAPRGKIEKKKRIKNPGEAKFFYLGRISPVKNLLQCITALQEVKNQKQIDFDIYGPVEDPVYWELCNSEIKKLPANIRVSYNGLLAHELLNDTLTDYHFLLLLTENENYGHAIVESMVCGCPVIISDRTPWRNLESLGAGWDLDLSDKDTIRRSLEIATGMDQHTFDTWSDNAYRKGVEIKDNPESVEDNKRLFR